MGSKNLEQERPLKKRNPPKIVGIRYGYANPLVKRTMKKTFFFFIVVVSCASRNLVLSTRAWALRGGRLSKEYLELGGGRREEDLWDLAIS